MQTQCDLFEDLRVQLLCEYISDMRFEPFQSSAKAELARMELSSYSLRALADADEYFYGVNLEFQSYSQAAEFFRG